MTHTLHGGGKKGGGGSGGWTIFHTLFYVFLFCITMAKCFGGSGSSISPGPPPTPPTQPAQKTATFYSDASAPAHLAVQLTGGTYTFQYIFIHPSQLSTILSASRKVAVADFIKGEVQGNPQDADDLIIIGRPNLTVGDFLNNTTADSQFTSVSGDIKYARFNVSAPPTGPPSGEHNTEKKDKIAKNIYVLGELASVTFGNLKQDARHHIDVLELDPTETEWRDYKAAYDEYLKRKNEYDFDVLHPDAGRYDTTRPTEHPL